MKLSLSTCIVFFFVLFASDADGQETRGQVNITFEPPPIIVEEGRLISLFAAFRENEESLVFELESEAEMVPVRFQTTVMRNGELIGRSTRGPITYFPGEMIMCPESFDFIPLLEQTTNEDGILPEGEYQVGIIVMSKEARPIGRESTFEFAVR